MIYSQYVKIINWNASGIRNKINEFYHYLITNHIDIACVCETFLKSNMQLEAHPNFTTYRFDREDRPKGGVLIIIRNRIKHALLPSLDTKLLECIGIQIELNDNSKLQIFSIYLPGGAKNCEINNHFKNDLRKITRRHTSFFAMGDFNCKHRFWNCDRANHGCNMTKLFYCLYFSHYDSKIVKLG
jgi:exonuclease III